MITQIQQIFYELLHNKVPNYTVYTCLHNNLKEPYILINSISIEPLPYTQEKYQYSTIKVIITIYDTQSSNKNILNAIDESISLIRQLTENHKNFRNLTITTLSRKDGINSTAEIHVSFVHIQ